MSAVRHLIAQRHLAVLICATALLLKLLVPTGYMIGENRGTLTVMVCSGVAARPMTIAIPGLASGPEAAHRDLPDHGKSEDHGKSGMPCIYSALSSQALAAVDADLLAVALAIVAALTLLALHRPELRASFRLRPPLRGPPISSAN